MIELTRGCFAIVDDEDFEALNQFKWHLAQSRPGGARYAEHSYRDAGLKDNFKMHQLIMCFPDKLIDHINGDGLHNRKENLRLCNNSENHMNIGKNRGAYSSKYKGVCARKNKWRASIRKDGTHIELGLFTSEEEAARAYDLAAIEYFGEYAKTNGEY